MSSLCQDFIVENGKQDKPKRPPGRPVGRINSLTRKMREDAANAGILPHEFLLKIVRGEPVFHRETCKETGVEIEVQDYYTFADRVDAAKAAAPYFAPRISSVEIIKNVSDHELDTIIAKLAAEAGIAASDGGEATSAGGEAPEAHPGAYSRPRINIG